MHFVKWDIFEPPGTPCSFEWRTSVARCSQYILHYVCQKLLNLDRAFKYNRQTKRRRQLHIFWHTLYRRVQPRKRSEYGFVCLCVYFLFGHNWFVPHVLRVRARQRLVDHSSRDLSPANPVIGVEMTSRANDVTYWWVTSGWRLRSIYRRSAVSARARAWRRQPFDKLGTFYVDFSVAEAQTLTHVDTSLSSLSDTWRHISALRGVVDGYHSCEGGAAASFDRRLTYFSVQLERILMRLSLLRFDYDTTLPRRIRLRRKWWKLRCVRFDCDTTTIRL